jgi:site-specific DNA-methyltransferase (cytosine-N4-specific)
VLSVLESRPFQQLIGKFQLILMSPPFPLNNKKSYGNLKGTNYVKWFVGLAPKLSALLNDTGSLVIELGNSWEPRRPVQSLLALKSLLGFVENKSASLRLIQEFVCYNPSRLPSPAEWVTIKRIRAVDSFTHVWWLAKTDFPKADNKRILRPYSKSMEKLLKRGDFNNGKRPSEHVISERGFLKNCGGSIAHNFLELEPLDRQREIRLPNAFSFSNTASNDFFSRECKKRKITPHPARMPMGLASFFIEYLTEKGDLVLDPFAGSNTTGCAAARLKRKWVAIDCEPKYASQSKIRFEDPAFDIHDNHRR